MWTQDYNPLNNPWLSTAAALLPAVAMLGSIALLKMRVHFAALMGLALTIAVAMGVYHMPGDMAAASCLYGAAFGLFPIGWIVINVVFLYHLTVKRGHFKILRESLSTMAPDPRVQVILIAFCFGAFLEGMAGFGAPVAITAAILLQLGFKPLHACGLALIANTAPVAFGSLGIPITTLAQVSGLDSKLIGAMVGRQLPFFSLILPFWIVMAFAGWRGMLGVWPAALTAGVTFAVSQFLVSNYHGPWLVDTVSGIAGMLSVVVLLRFWKPKDKWHPTGDGSSMSAPLPPRAFEEDSGDSPVTSQSLGGRHLEEACGVQTLVRPGATNETDDSRVALQPSCGVQIFHAWLPWIILTLFIFLWGTPQFTSELDKVFLPKIAVPHLHRMIQRVPPIALPNAKPESAELALNALSATGTGILAAAVLAAFAMGFSLKEMAGTYALTLWQSRLSLLTISSMLAFGTATKFSGIDGTLGLALAHTGALYPFFGTMLGWLGVALTGSDTSSNVLFGSLQKITAMQTGISPVLMAAANTSGGVMGKMLAAQSIVIASTATDWYGHEGEILRYVFFHSVSLAALMGVLVYLQAYVTPFSLLVIK